MGRRSTFDRLPQPVVEAVNRAIRKGATIAEVCELMDGLGEPTPPSTVGRYMKSARESMERYRQASEVAGQWVSQLGENPSGDVGALLAEMLKTIAFQTLVQVGDNADEKAPKPMDIMLLAKAIKDLEATSKANIERREKIRKTALEFAMQKVGEVGKRSGISQASIDEIERELGLR